MKLYQSTAGKTPAFFHREDIFTAGRETLDLLKKAMREDKSGRVRLCLHQSRREKVQEMIIAIGKNTYIRPHKQLTRTESFQVLEGRMQMTIFDNRGRIIKKIKMAPVGGDLPFVCRLKPNIWHMAAPLNEYAIFYEVLEGPFTKAVVQQASWAPKEDETEKIKTFLKKCLC